MKADKSLEEQLDEYGEACARVERATIAYEAARKRARFWGWFTIVWLVISAILLGIVLLP